jgi:hypothetical protein
LATLIIGFVCAKICIAKGKSEVASVHRNAMQARLKRNRAVKREKTNKMQQSDVYYQLLSQHVSGIVMPIFRRTKTVLLHMVYCAGSAGYGW